MKIVRGFFRLLAKLCGLLLVLLSLAGAVILMVAVSELLFDGGFEAFIDYLEYQKEFFFLYAVILVSVLLFGVLGGKSDGEKKNVSKPLRTYSVSGRPAGSGIPSDTFCEPSLFDADDYVTKHCTGYIYGLVTESDVDTIKNDDSLSSYEKDEALAQLEHKAIIYY